MTTTVIERRICIDPQFLDSNILQHLFDKVVTSTYNECSKEYGYIINIKKIIGIKDNWISTANSDIVFTVVFEAITLKPEIDSQFIGEVCLVFPNGVLLDVQNKLKFLIPLSSLIGYELNREGMYYEKDDKKIEKGDKLLVKVAEIQYKNKVFMCFGSIVDE